MVRKSTFFDQINYKRKLNAINCNHRSQNKYIARKNVSKSPSGRGHRPVNVKKGSDWLKGWMIATDYIKE